MEGNHRAAKVRSLSSVGQVGQAEFHAYVFVPSLSQCEGEMTLAKTSERP